MVSRSPYLGLLCVEKDGVTCVLASWSNNMEKGAAGTIGGYQEKGVDEDDRMISGEEKRTRHGLLLIDEQRRTLKEASGTVHGARSTTSC